MAPVKSITRRTLLVIITGLATSTRLRLATAQSGAANGNQSPFSIAVPNFSNDSSGGASGRNLTPAIISDLRASGRFAPIAPGKSVEEKTDIDAVPQFDKWRSINVEWLVTGRVTSEPNQRIKVQFFLWNVMKGEQVLGQQYWLKLDDWDRVPHLIADAIFERLTGENGHFDEEHWK